MTRASLVLALCLAGGAACVGEAPAGTGTMDAAPHAREAGTSDAGAPDLAEASASAPAAIECFAGTPRTQDELLNACWPDTVAAIRKTVMLPGGYQVGSPLPPAPAP